MPKRYSEKEIADMLKAAGWKERRGKGDHRIFTKDGHRSIPLPSHGKHLKTGTAYAILKQAGLKK